MHVKRSLLLLVSILAVMSLISCGGGGGGGDTGGGGGGTTTGTLRVINNTASSMTAVYLSPSNQTTWGPNQLSSSIPANGGTRDIINVPAGTYDFKANMADGTYATLFGISITAGGTFTVTVNSSGSGTTGSLRTINNTSLTVTQLYISPSTSTTWGTNQLGSNTIAPGGSYLVYNIPAGTYDFKAVMSDSSYYTSFGINIAAGSTVTVTLNPASVGAVKVQNNSSVTIWYVYLRPAGSANWGVDQLGSSTIAPGATFTITNVPAGQYDFRSVKSNAVNNYLYNFTVTAGQTFTVIVP